MFHKIAEFILQERLRELENRVAELESENKVKVLQVDMTDISKELHAYVKEQAKLIKDEYKILSRRK